MGQVGSQKHSVDAVSQGTAEAGQSKTSEFAADGQDAAVALGKLLLEGTLEAVAQLQNIVAVQDLVRDDKTGHASEAMKGGEVSDRRL